MTLIHHAQQSEKINENKKFFKREKKKKELSVMTIEYIKHEISKNIKLLHIMIAGMNSLKYWGLL